MSISSNLWHTLNGFNNSFSFFFLQLRMFIMENSKFPIMLGTICYLIPIPRCSKIWLAKLKLDWMNCLSTQRWEKRLFSIFVWRILGKIFFFIIIQIQKFLWFIFFDQNNKKTHFSVVKPDKTLSNSQYVEPFWHATVPISNSPFDKKYHTIF